MRAISLNVSPLRKLEGAFSTIFRFGTTLLLSRMLDNAYWQEQGLRLIVAT